MTFVCSEIFSIIVSRNNPLTRKIRADDKAFLLSGREITGRTLGLPRSCLRKKEKQEEKEAQGRKKRREREREREQREQEGERAKEYKEVWRGRAGLSENIGRTRSSEIKEEKINPRSPRWEVNAN